MIRKNTGSSMMAAAGAANQENNPLRQKAVDQPSGAVVRPAMRFALGDIKNNQPTQGPKRTTSLKAVKTETDAAIAPKAESKIEPRRPLRTMSSLTNASIPVAKPLEQKQTRAVSKNVTSTSTSTIGANSSLASVANASAISNGSNASVVGQRPKPSASILGAKLGAAAVGGRGRLLRSNAVSSLHAAAVSMNVGDGNSTKAETSELVAMQAALCLAPVKEETEAMAVQSPARDDAYSSSMMPNIDAGDEDDPQTAVDYVNDIYNYLRSLEKQKPIKENFLDGKEVTGRMRGILIDWLSQVHLRFHLLPETMYMTVGLIDRFLQEVKIAKEKLQLLGVTAMFVASKYEEMYAPEITDFVYITDSSCSKQDIRTMECVLLRSLSFRLGRPLPIHFLRRYSKAAEADAEIHTMAKYFLELSLAQYSLAHYPPSVMAAAALCLSLKLLKPGFEWSPVMIYYSKYREDDFAVCLQRLGRALIRTHTEEIKYQAIRNKFSTSKFLSISKHPCLDMENIRKCGGF